MAGTYVYILPIQNIIFYKYLPTDLKIKFPDTYSTNTPTIAMICMYKNIP